MNRLQIQPIGPYFNSFLPHSYSYEPANELKPDLNRPNFRFGSASPTSCYQQKLGTLTNVINVFENNLIQ
jgi:hypothetical protein